MYNRYIPQPDGSYRRNRVQEPKRTEHPSGTKREVNLPPRQDISVKEDTDVNQKIPVSRQDSSIGSFLKQLLPKGLDTGDLLIILLLLLMAGDCAEDQNTALLTLVLYLFM